MLKKTVALLMCVGLAAGGYAVSASSSAQQAALSTLATLTPSMMQTQEAGDLTSLAGAESVAAAGVVHVQPQKAVNQGAMALSFEDAEKIAAAARTRQEARRAGKPRPFVPVPTGNTARSVFDASPESEVRETVIDALDTRPQAPNDLRFFTSHNLTSTEVPTGLRSTIMEPTSINLGNAVFYTGNWFAARSTDGGNTFTFVNPFTLFPSVNDGFCCDQWTAYAPNQDMALWALQYIEDGSSNTLRLARTIGAAGVAANNWVYWDLTPQQTGFGANVWYDYPNMTVAGNSLYVATNAFSTINNAYAGDVVMRFSLAELAAGNVAGYSYYRSPAGTVTTGTKRLAEGSGTTIYFAGFRSTTQMNIFRWTEGSNQIFIDAVNLNAFNWLSRNGVATSPDGSNWALRADSRPTGAYLAQGVMGVMWTARQGTGRPYPYVVHARFNATTRALMTQADIWHNTVAYMYPSASPNSAGHLAGTIHYGGGSSYPNSAVWITDDVTGASNAWGAAYQVQAGNRGPSNNGWGDYFSVRPHKTMPRTWVAATHVLRDGGAGSNAVPNYLWFGRERDVAQAAAMISPANGSSVFGTSGTFSWNAGSGASSYWLYVGTTGVGSRNILDQNQGTSLSKLVTGLPANNTTIYVRLWSYLSGGIGWAWNDYTYTSRPPLVPAQITSPANGANIFGPSVNFTWNTGVNATQYWLYVGTTGVGSANILNQTQGTSLTKLVTGLPANNTTVYVRLWTLITGAGWAWNDYTYISRPSCVPAFLTSPGGPQLPGSTVAFTWNAGSNNTQYWLYVGTTPGGSQVYDQNQGTNLSTTVTGVPTNGLPVFARLWSYCGAWNYRDYPLQTAGVRGKLYRAPGGMLSGSSATFAWATGSGSSQYWLYVGSARGAADIYNQDAGTDVSRNVTGIPIDGRRIYVRLWSLVGGVWYYSDYDFTAAGTTRARLTSHTDVATLGGASATLGWAAGTGATAYWVYVGNTPGGIDIANVSTGTNLSTVITGLPTDRRPVYVRLWTLTGGVWVYNDYVLRAYDGGAARARLTIPLPDATLVGSSTTFSWVAGSGATQYWLYVGTSRGATNLHNASHGTNLSATVGGLPTNGSTIYVRLWTLNGGIWSFNDYEFTAAP
jgi:hypothetical protein